MVKEMLHFVKHDKTLTEDETNCATTIKPNGIF